MWPTRLLQQMRTDGEAGGEREEKPPVEVSGRSYSKLVEVSRSSGLCTYGFNHVQVALIGFNHLNGIKPHGEK